MHSPTRGALAAIFLFSGLICKAQTVDNPNFSSAIYCHQSANDLFNKTVASLNASQTLLRYVYLPDAAKAALEAGEFAQAQAYAVEGIQAANQKVSKHQNLVNPRAYTGIGTVDFYCNFVLGRLAFNRGDINGAEQYLLAASKTSGDVILNGYGPNMSLAYEILQSGDPNRWAVVQAFLENCRQFWTQPKLINAWIANVENKVVSDFKEQLYR